MTRNKHMMKIHDPGLRAQAIVEFAIVLPILLVILVGILEVGRYIFIYSSVTNASRNASRYASAVGVTDDGLTKFNYCEGIKNVALQSSYLIPDSSLAVQITYDDGEGNPLADSECNVWNAAQVDTGVAVTTGDRVTVTVTADYVPIVNLIPIEGRTITASSSRTILGIVDIDD